MASLPYVATSELERKYLWTCTNGLYLKLSPSAYHLLKCVEAGISFETIAEALSRKQGYVVTATEVQAAHQQLREQIETTECRTVSMPSDFWLRLPLLPASVVAAIAYRLSWLFRPGLALFLAAIIIIVHGAVLAQGMTLHYAAQQYWQGYAFYLAAILAHELGHASACARYGARPNAIGLSIYWFFPVVYADVSAAWTLKRWQRVVVDLGGAYFQALLVAACGLVYLLTGWVPLKVALTMSVINSLFILNPILKFDGYWVLADALGVTNLAMQPARIARHYFAKFRGQATTALPWPPRIVVLLSIYSIVAFGFWFYYATRLVPFIWQQVLGYPLLLEKLYGYAINGVFTELPMALLAFITSSAMIAFSVLMLYRLIGQRIIALAQHLPSPLRQKP